MTFLCGWKEIAEHLQMTVRTAQRWENLGLPVHRAHETPHSPVVALKDELELWVQTRQTRVREHATESHALLASHFAELRSTQRKTHLETRRLITQVSDLGNEQRRLIQVIKATLTSASPARQR